MKYLMLDLDTLRPDHLGCYGYHRNTSPNIDEIASDSMLFDDLVNLLAFGRITACGMVGRCQNQIIVEADGSVYPCDFYCLDRYCLGNLSQHPLSALLTTPKTREFVNRPHNQPKLCAGCEFQKICGGNCKRMQSSMCCSDQDDFCGYRDFLSHCYRDLALIAHQQRQFRR